jgi:UDPglucose--hexose-1-phosphate uridylyltransferase
MAQDRDKPELRKDPVSGRWVIIAPERGRRPSALPGRSPVSRGEPCPFCPGNERATPPEITARRAPGSPPNGPGWTTRVIPNKFAALAPEGKTEVLSDGIYERMDGVGEHEVIIESPEHDRELSELPVERIEQVLEVAGERALALAHDPRIRYVLIFKNYGEWAGASQEHSHMQILATPVVPDVAAEELAESRRRFESDGRCIFCAMVDHEGTVEERLVAGDARFVAFAPYASRFAYETWILPRRHASSFERITPEERRALAGILRETLGSIRRALDRPCYNFLIHSAPCRERELDYYHWHVEIVPKLSRASGFEWGTGAYINATPPEEAARRLAEREPAERPAP